jgi:hypothetical protein
LLPSIVKLEESLTTQGLKLPDSKPPLTSCASEVTAELRERSAAMQSEREERVIDFM